LTAPARWCRPARWPLPLRTDRLWLRAPAHEDAAALHGAIESARDTLLPWLPWAGCENLTLGQTHYTIERFVREMEREEPTQLAVVVFDAADGACVGGTGLHPLTPEAHQAELGYWVRPERRGLGLAAEAACALTACALRPADRGGLGLRRLVIRCAAANTPSARVAEKCGYVPEGRLRADRWAKGIGWCDTLVFGALAGEWRDPRGGADGR